MLLLLASCDAVFGGADFSMTTTGEFESVYSGDAQIGRQNNIVGATYLLRVEGDDRFDLSLQTLQSFIPRPGTYSLADSFSVYDVSEGEFVARFSMFRGSNLRTFKMTEGTVTIGACSARGIQGSMKGKAVRVGVPLITLTVEATFEAPHNFSRNVPRTTENLCP